MSYNYLKKYLDPNIFHINIYDNKIYIINYEKILTLGSCKIIIKAPLKKIILEGRNFALNKLANKELLILGNLDKAEIKYE